MEFNQESNDEQNQNDDMVDEFEDGQPTMKQWFQDNLRIIVSIFIVVVIAAGIYSYSNRSQEITQDEQTEQSDILKDLTKTDQKIAEENKNEAKTPEKKSEISSTTTSQETAESFVETAGKGDGTTKLARKALADYLEKNSDSSLTPEHKIYIEDYLRKNVGHRGSVHIGTSVEFSKSLIGDAIAKSKNLNEKQLQNLHKYAVRVPSLS